MAPANIKDTIWRLCFEGVNISCDIYINGNRTGMPKDAYYVFKSHWTTNPRFTFIESKSWKDRFGKENQPRQVCVFSNCDQVKLVLNGKDQGLKTRDINEFPPAV